MRSAAQAKRDRRDLMRAIERELKTKNRAKLVRLRDQWRTLRDARRAQLAEALLQCKARRPPTLAAVRAELRRERAAAREACNLDRAKARTLKDKAKQARAELVAERDYQRALRRIEAANREKQKRAKRPLVKTRASESDDEVRGNIPPELVPLFDRVRKQIRATDRMNRTEAFLQYAHDHESEGEQWAALEDRVDETIRALERRQAMANPKKKKPKKSARPQPRKGLKASARRALPLHLFALPKIRELPLDTAKRTRNAPARLEMMHNAGHVSSHDYAEAKRRIAARSRHFGIESRYEKKGRPARKPKKHGARPVGRWWDRILASREARRYPSGDRATLHKAYLSLPQRQRAAQVQRMFRAGGRQRRAAVAIARAEHARAEGPPARRTNPRPMTDAGALEEYERTHWGRRGRQSVRDGRAADPRYGTAAVLGELVEVVYETRKGDDREVVHYEHAFEGRRPKLAYNAGGLLIVGGDYKVRERGIVG